MITISDWVMTNNVAPLIVAMIISQNIQHISRSFVGAFIDPYFDTDCDGKLTMNDMRVQLMGSSVPVGRLLGSLTNAAVVTAILYIFVNCTTTNDDTNKIVIGFVLGGALAMLASSALSVVIDPLFDSNNDHVLTKEDATITLGGRVFLVGELITDVVKSFVIFAILYAVLVWSDSFGWSLSS